MRPTRFGGTTTTELRRDSRHRRLGVPLSDPGDPAHDVDCSGARPAPLPASVARQCRCTLDGRRFLLVHATPRDPLDEYLLKDPGHVVERLQNVEADIVCVGHTHIQFNIQVGDVTVINPGSVGLPRDGDPRAAFAMIEDDKIELKRIDYPIDHTIARIEQMPWPRWAKEIIASVLRLGRLSPVMERLIPNLDDEPEHGLIAFG